MNQNMEVSKVKDERGGKEKGGGREGRREQKKRRKGGGAGRGKRSRRRKRKRRRGKRKGEGREGRGGGEGGREEEKEEGEGKGKKRRKGGRGGKEIFNVNPMAPCYLATVYILIEIFGVESLIPFHAKEVYGQGALLKGLLDQLNGST